MPGLFDEVPWWTTADMNNALARENRPKPRGFRLNSADRINAEYGPLVYDDQSATAFATDQSQKLLEQRGQPGVLSKLLIGGAANAMEAAGVPGVFDPDGTVRGQTWGNALRASSWIPQDTIEGVGQAVTAPARAYRGEIQDEDMISEGLNFAGNMAMTGSIAPKPSNAAGMFGGRLAKTADHAKLKTAEEMAAKGAPREDIWSQTGWFKSPDGHWKFEIDDSKAGFLVPPKRTSDRTDRVHHRNVSDVFSHPDLYAAYPDAANASLVMRGSPGGSYYDPIKFGLEKPRIEVYNKEFSTMKPDSILLHELQHGVQYNEGFAKGGSLQSVGEDPALRTAQAEASSQRKTTDQLLNDWMIAPRDGKDAAWAAYQAGKDAELAAKNKARDVAAALPSPDEYYRRLAGEAEARAVQTRQHLTSEQRAARPPWMDFDVPEADQIALYGNGKSSGVPGVLLSQAEAARQPKPVQMEVPFYRGSAHGQTSVDYSQPYWGTSDKGLASDYAKSRSRTYFDAEATPNVTPAVARFRNPLHIDAQNAGWSEVPFEGQKWNTDKLAETAKQRGHDGLVIDRLYDEGRWNPDEGLPSTVAALRPGTVSSAFDPNNILYSNSKNSVPGALAAEAADLPMDAASRMARAKQMGFDTGQTWYRGDAEPFSAFDPAYAGAKYGEADPLNVAGFDFTKSKPLADWHADGGVTRDFHLRGDQDVNLLDGTDRLIFADKPIQDALTSSGVRIDNKTTVQDAINQLGGGEKARQALLSAGVHGVYHNMDRGIVRGDTSSIRMLDPTAIRSTNAAFDPAKSSSANLLAANKYATVPGVLLSEAADKRIQNPIRASHVSGADFDRFDFGKIGSGYGHHDEGRGLYFGQHKGLLDSYANELGDKAKRYDVAIHADESKFGDWDTLPSDIQDALRTERGAQAAVQSGMPGVVVKHPQGNSYVVFDQNTPIDILRKYGLLGTLGGGAALAMQPGQAEAKQ